MCVWDGVGWDVCGGGGGECIYVCGGWGEELQVILVIFQEMLKWQALPEDVMEMGL